MKNNRYFEKFAAKVKLVNPNIELKQEDWIACNNKIKGYCNLHNESFDMYKAITYAYNNCPKCRINVKFTKEELEDISTKFKEIDKEFKENRKKDASEKYVRIDKGLKENKKLFKILENKL